VTDYYPSATGPELINFLVSKNGSPVTTGVSFYVAEVVNGTAVPPLSTSTFTPAVIASDGSTCWQLAADTARGEYYAWARIVDSNNTVVVTCGGFRVI
jgi:hypothetical protein